MLEGISNGAFTPVCRQTIAKQISTQFEAIKSNLIDIFAETDFVCTTADIWSRNNKSYFGVTAHVIVNDTLKRKSFTLACSGIRFSHTYKEIGKALSDIHALFHIRNDKISGTVTDNATNFGKAFRVFSCTDETEGRSKMQLESQENEVDTVDVDFQIFAEMQMMNLTTISSFSRHNSGVVHIPSIWLQQQILKRSFPQVKPFYEKSITVLLQNLHLFGIVSVHRLKHPTK